MASTFRNTLDFFDRLGIYDVILPFLLVFTLVFGILEKTKILGLDKVGDKEYTKKSLNAMVAFTVAFFVIASSKVVAIINETLANTFVLLLMSILFLMLFGTFYKEGEDFWKEGLGKSRYWIGAAMGIGIILIFLHAIGWLETAWDYVWNHWDDNAVASLILIIIVVFFMWLIVREPAHDKSKESK